MSAGLLSASRADRRGQPGPDAAYVDADSLRTTFALAMSTMYKAEVPLYGDLMQIVQNVNRDAQTRRVQGLDGSATMDASVERLTLERHGAIRLGTPRELHTVRRIFGLLGMHAVGYYDLSAAGLPMHATCFRPTSPYSLEQNPFRVFTTLLRPDLVKSGAARAVALDLLQRRNIFSDALLRLLDVAEGAQEGRLTPQQGEKFVVEALRTFSWQPLAAATRGEYALLRSEHPILADVACFRSSHINHLTPRTLDISAAQEAMLAAGMAVKSRIEGPPPRKCPILLRQTSFLALQEGIRFPVSGRDELVEGFHKARFGEIEERGASVTPAGRKLRPDTGRDVSGVSRHVGRVAASWARLLRTAHPPSAVSSPRVYWKHCPSRGTRSAMEMEDITGPDLEGYERALQCRVLDANGLYALAQRRSLEKCAEELGLGLDDVSHLLC
ncbi:Uncharacterized protein Cob_v011882 [Colletotrichum orbiculare MAFF 240422]|uniref:2-oxoadipate dioxygenase/decarboxylase n=1 Tax=Colletotrichum orbiculare (strain 104-T / ATCC 96160 / CBS 514.97 / LARS 414 / MAFF 240422) TaxID=1213857 RepID=A0A484FCA0_COLOR|nr:Uncharacterized protein Cob_v011882 [Colletotrichum orbiculare MAFF 240422]